MRKIKILGKSVPVFALILAGLATIGAAALLINYGTITSVVNVQQSILLDGKDVNTGSLTITDIVSEAAPGGEKFCNIHTLKNQMSVAGSVKLQSTCSELNYLNCDGITQTYETTITDTTTNPIASFGDKHNEVCGEYALSQMTLDQVFAGNGLIYNYTIVNGGTWNGASPIVAVLDLADGRHVVLFPGWGDRTGPESLVFGDTVSYSTADSGNVVVDFTVYSSTWNNLFSSSGSYPAWTAVKSLPSVPVTGNEYVTSISFQHQSANTGETDTLNGFAFDSKNLQFNNAIVNNSPFSLASGKEIAVCLCNNFAQAIAPGTYTITTNVVPQ